MAEDCGKAIVYKKKNIYVCIFTPNARMYTKENEYDTVLALALTRSEYMPKSIKNERTNEHIALRQPVSSLQ
jgi:hypothetical protein